MAPFFGRVLNYLVNQMVVNGLANSRTFQRFAVRTSKTLDDFSVKAVKKKQELAEQMKEKKQELAEQMKDLSKSFDSFKNQ